VIKRECEFAQRPDHRSGYAYLRSGFADDYWRQRALLVFDQAVKFREEINGRRLSPDAPDTVQVPYLEISTREIVNSFEVPIEKLAFYGLDQRKLEMDRVRQLVQANPFAILVTSPSQVQPVLRKFFKDEKNALHCSPKGSSGKFKRERDRYAHRPRRKVSERS